MNDVLSLNRFISISVNVNFDWRLNHVVHNDFFAKGFCCKLSLFVPYIFRLPIQAKSSVRGDMDYDEVVSFLIMFVCEYVYLNFCKFSYFQGVGCDWQVWALAEVDRSIVSVTFS